MAAVVVVTAVEHDKVGWHWVHMQSDQKLTVM